jgi:hypothetical protein
MRYFRHDPSLSRETLQKRVHFCRYKEYESKKVSRVFHPRTNASNFGAFLLLLVNLA